VVLPPAVRGRRAAADFLKQCHGEGPIRRTREGGVNGSR
jgi:hypothetical protein